jgi:hypothetical protein
MNSNDTNILKQRVKLTSNPSNDFGGELLRLLSGSDKKLTDVQIRSLTSCFGSYIGALVCILFTAAAIYVASIDKRALTNRYYVYSAFIILPILFGSALILPIFRAGIKPQTMVLLALMVILVIVTSYFFMRNMNPQTVVWANYILFALVAFFIVSVMAIAYKVFIKYLKNLPGWGGFIVKLLFFIPCMFLDFVQYLVNDYNNTPKIVGVVFIIQLIVLAGYILIPRIYKYFAKYSNVPLVNKPISLQKQSIIGKNEIFKLDEFTAKDSYIRFDPVHPDGNISNQYRQNFSVSMWVFINNSGIHNAGYTGETPIFRYGDPYSEISTLGKPLIAYSNRLTNEGQNEYVIYFTNSDSISVSHRFSVPPQKWNNFVVTYNEGKVDLFVNGALEHSHTFHTDPDNTSSYPIFNKYDVMAVGYGDDDDKETRKINGAICNVNYYKTPLSLSDIANNYNLLKNKTPPLNYIV